MDSKILILDIETTGYTPKNKIVEIGIVSLDLLTGNIETLFDELINEDSLTLTELADSWIIANSDMKIEDVWAAKNLQHYFDDIQKIINDHPLGVTAFSKTFDFAFFHDRGFVIPVELRDPMKISRDIVNALDKNGRIKNPKVEEAYKHFYPGEDYIEKHRGADDAHHEAKIVYSLYKMGKF